MLRNSQQEFNNVYSPKCQTIPLTDLKHQISLYQHKLIQISPQTIKKKDCLPAVAIPLRLCVILDVFTIDEIPEEAQYMQYISILFLLYGFGLEAIKLSLPSTLHSFTCFVVQTLLDDSSTVWVLSHLQQDLLHVSVFTRGINQLCDLLLQRPRQRHQLDKLALWAFVNLHQNKQRCKMRAITSSSTSCHIYTSHACVETKTWTIQCFEQPS